jgi:hypothetical protein
MAKKMGYYNVEDFTRQKKQQEKEIVVPPRPNFLAAAKHLRSLFDSKKFTYAFMGGLEVLCLGYRREMPDLQIAYDDRDFNRIKAKLEADQRYVQLTWNAWIQLIDSVFSFLRASILCFQQRSSCAPAQPSKMTIVRKLEILRLTSSRLVSTLKLCEMIKCLT